MTQTTWDIEAALGWMRRAAARLDRAVMFMEVCGTHTMNAFRSGLPSLLPDNVSLRSGPGCPVCVTAPGEIDTLIALAEQPQVTLCTYGDMLRVPGQRGSLEAQRGRGADVRVIYSALDAVKLASGQPQRQVVLAAVGFETTAPATAAAIERADAMDLSNFTVLVSHKRVIPAMEALLAGGDVAIDGFLCPGHVSVILGAEAYRDLVARYAAPCVIAGFEPLQMATALAQLVQLVADGRAELVNQYPQAVRDSGNRAAQALLDRVFAPATARWRGLGEMADSGMALRPRYQRFDALHRFGLTIPNTPEPRGCLCGQVIAGRATPDQCRLFGVTCTPPHPIGPCMVSSEGTCAAWFKYRHQRTPTATAAPTDANTEVAAS